MHAQITYQDQSRWGQNPSACKCVQEDGGMPGDGSDGFREAITRHLVTPLGRDYTEVYTDDAKRRAGETIQGCVRHRRLLISVAV